MVASFAAFAWGTIKTVTTTLLIVQSLGKDATITIELIELIDIFLIATTILIFSASLYELFIGKLDMPEWMLAHDLYELKAVKQYDRARHGGQISTKLIEVKDGMELLQRGIAIAVVSAALIAFGYFGKKD
ncbi:MAG: YqhA family protein [Anaerolineales bacterium]|nr:YqhA family protein [Anaerolineales bacterium]